MMEFTVNGAVRHGFGFYNPNHAAALFCALLPLLWAAWQRWRHPAVRTLILAAAALLLTALALTYSRTGAVVALAELLILGVPGWRRHWRLLLGLGLLLLAALAVVGVWGRFTLDRAALNRLEIWRAGAALFAANPWSGVGFGNSGELAGLFLLPPEIRCRTLVNSHLTLLAEWGAPLAWVWLSGIGYALLRGWRRRCTWTAFAGLLVSSSNASLFDWEVLLDFQAFGGLPLLNFLLSWLTLLLFIGLGVFLSWGKPCWKLLAIAMGGTLVLLLSAGIAGRDERAPQVDGEFLLLPGVGEPPLVLYDAGWSLEQVLRRLPDGGRISLRHWQYRAAPPPETAETVWLFGECISFAKFYPHSKLVLVSPPRYREMPPGVERVYYRRFTETPPPGVPATAY